MRYLTLAEILELHLHIVAQSGGAEGVHDLGGVEAAVAQPQLSFDGNELYPTLEAKATALCFALVSNHPFVDGNKRIGHASMEVFLFLNGHELVADVDSAEAMMLQLAGGVLTRDELLAWVAGHIRETT